MPRKQVGAIDKDLLDRVDEARGDVPRVKFVERALEAALGNGPVSGEGVRLSSPSSVREPACPCVALGFPGAYGLTSRANSTGGSDARLAAPLSRRCEKCGKEFGSPSLRRCTVCNGKIVPEPS